MFKKSIFVLLTVSMLLALQVTSVSACSGYPYFGVEDLPSAELLVRVTVIDTDDRGFNAVLRVEDYYKGEGPRLLTVMRYRPALTTGALVRGYDTSCLYAGRGHHFQQGSQGYFGLESNGDGTYTDDISGTAHFIPVDGKITYQEGATEGYYAEFDEAKTITEEAFIGKMLDAGGRDAPVQPIDAPAFHYPLMRFLTFTTENGTHYQINPDRSVTELAADGPLAISPDGAHVAFRVDDETIALQYIWTTYQYAEEEDSELETDSYKHLKVSGHHVAFSSDSNFIAVWDQEQLSIYMLSNDGNSILYGYGNGLRVHQVAQVNVSNITQVLWSADSSTLVWEDDSDIWHWNIVNEAEPTHLTTDRSLQNVDSGATALMDVSTYGGYIRFGNANEWWLYDTATNEGFFHVLISPDERFFIGRHGQVMMTWDDEMACIPPLRNTCIRYTVLETQPIGATFSYGSNLLGLTSCNADTESCAISHLSWHPAIWSGYSTGRSAISTVVGGRQIIYDQQYAQPAILVGDYSIYFDFYSEYVVEEYAEYLDTVDVEDEVDSPIVSIAWGQPVFYDEYLLTTTTYLP